MTRKFTRFLRGNAIALLALFVALGGTSFAASSYVLPKNSVGTKQLKTGAVTKKKINKRTIAALKGNRGPRGFRGPKGAAGPQGIQGLEGVRGPIGPSNGYAIYNEPGPGGGVGIGDTNWVNVLSLALPAGSYVITAKGTAYIPSGSGFVSCYLVNEGANLDYATADLAPTSGVASSTISLVGAVETGGGSATLRCRSNASSSFVYYAHIAAVNVGTISFPAPVTGQSSQGPGH